MGGALHPGIARAGVSFELERLELDGGLLVVSGWWFGVRGLRFVRPAVVVDGRQVLARIDDKPWPLAADGAWTAAFPWDDGRELDVGGMTLVVAPSVEVSLDREAEAAARAPGRALATATAPPSRATERDEAAGADRDSGDMIPGKLGQLERELDAAHAELEAVRASADLHEARCRELEHVAGRERRAADEAEAVRDEVVRAHAIAVQDRDRAVAQHEEAVIDREAAMRARKRMETQRGEAVEQRASAEARRDEVIAQRDEARRGRDEVLLAHRALQRQLKSEWAQADRTRSSRDAGARRDARPRSSEAPSEASPEAVRRVPAADAGDVTAPASDGGDGFASAVDGDGLAPSWEHEAAPPASDDPPPTRSLAAAPRSHASLRSDEPIGVRVLPAARVVAAHLHRAQRVREHGVTEFDLWVVRILGTVAALCFITLLVMILKAFFAF